MDLCRLSATWLVVLSCLSPAMAQPPASDDATSSVRAGFCLLLGAAGDLSPQLFANPDLVIHCLEADQDVADALQAEFLRQPPVASVIVEHWTSSRLPHVDNIANAVVVQDRGLYNRTEALRVAAPGAAIFLRDGDSLDRIVKQRPAAMGQWTHQWHAADGGLTTDDELVGVPRGFQWLAGPLFAMAGRKSSTQSLVSAGGRNFYITQNVLENVGRDQMDQYLVARDAFNGLILWQRPWNGPFVTGNGETNPRIVASAERLYVAGAAQVLCLDALTGKQQFVLAAPSGADKLALTEASLFVQSSDRIAAADPKSGAPQWELAGKAFSGLVIAGERLLVLESHRAADGNFQHDLVSLDAETGKRGWITDTRPQSTLSRLRINFASDGIVALQSHGFLHIYALEDGQHLWTKTTDARPGKTYVDERFVGHFLKRGLVWMLAQNSPREFEGQNTWVGLDPRTGAEKKRLTTSGRWPQTATPAKMGCQLLIASDRFIMIPRQATFIDFDSGEKLPFKFTRGGCGLGFVPANGLVYSHPHACGCFSEAVRGFMAMHARPAPAAVGAGQARLTVGPAFAAATAPETTPDDWAMHRGDPDRGAYSPSRLSGDLVRKWSTMIAPKRETRSARGWRLRAGPALTAATIVGDTAYVADAEQGVVRAVDIETGKFRWSFVAAGRVDSPPTITAGKCLFGSHDGFVYCVRASDGQLCWKFRAAPTDRRIIAFGGVESSWPVAGTVLVQDGVAYAAAGRAPDADGGIHVFALDAERGKLRWESRVRDDEYFGLCDYLVGSRNGVYLSNTRFEPATGEQRPHDVSTPHLQGGKVGLLEASWTRHDLALRKEIQTWTRGDVAGQLLAFGDGATVAYRAEQNVVKHEGECEWSHEFAAPSQVTALALTRNRVAVGVGDRRSDPLAGGRLNLLDRITGKSIRALDLPAEPVFDGLSIAHGKVFVATQDGQLHCFAHRLREAPSD